MYKKMSINDKLATLKYNKSNESHLCVDNDICMRCSDKPCIYMSGTSI